MACNLRCGHCGSKCENALADELNTEEALAVLDSLGNLNAKRVVFSGGEALLRKDIFTLIKECRKRGVSPYLISNGWNIDAETARKLKESRIVSVSISVDGTEEIHNKIRRKGSYERIMSAFDYLADVGIIYDVITTVNKKNIDCLYELAKALEAKNVCYWQIQLMIPMGNAAEDKDLQLDFSDVQKLIDICDDISKNSNIKITFGDNVGYYDKKITAVFTRTYGERRGIWHSCTAGISTVGIKHNGDVVGCMSIRNDEFAEGNVRERKLEDIWNSDKAFLWRRQFDDSKLQGFCGKCRYREYCKGGCSCMRYFTGGDIYSENNYCSYNYEMKK